MQGYCQNCKKMVAVDEVTTVRLPNHSFIHRGLCSNEKCRGLIFVKIYEQDILIDDAGHKCPKEVYEGKGTPKNIAREVFGQKIITKDGIIDTALQAGEIKTVYELKEELKKEKRDEKV